MGLKMKLIAFFLGFAFLSLSFAEQYTDRYDDLNVDEVLSNKRLFSSYLKCVLDKGRCTPEGKAIKIMYLLQQGILIFCLMYQYNCNTTYTTKYDGVDLDEILANDRLLAGYVNCLLDNGPCTPDGKELKNNLPDAIENDCKKCTERQREGADKVMHYIIDHKPDDWEKLEHKYNPDGSYKLKYLASKEKEHPEAQVHAKGAEDDDDDEDDENVSNASRIDTKE